MEKKIVTTDANGISEDGLPTYSQNNVLIRGEKTQAVEVWQWDYKPPAMTYGWRDADLSNYERYTFEDFAKANWGLQTRRIYRQVAIKEEKATTEESSVIEEKELHYCLSDNGDLNGLYLANMREVSEHIEIDLGDIEPSDRENVQYTITPVYLTQTEFNNLPEYEG